MKRVCLLVVFNHKYNKNIPILRKLYKDKFDDVFFLVPFDSDNGFCSGLEPDIIPVWESSYCFQGYFAQAYGIIKNSEYTHYIMIGDDLILNPAFNQNNIIEMLGMQEHDSYIKSIVPFGKSHGDQSNKLYSILSPFRINTGVSYKNEIPPYEEAARRCKQHNVGVTEKLPIAFFMNKGYIHPKHLLLTLVTLAINKGRKLPYPLFKSYSDMIIVDKDSMGEFCRLSGVFAAMNIFVETAIPLAMLLACSHIKYEASIRYKGIEKWGEEIANFEHEFGNDLNNLVDNYGDGVLYYHPVKLSKWTYTEE